MGAGYCSCCETHPGKGLELNITSPKNKLSLLGFNSFFSPKGQPSDAELQIRIRLLQTVNSSKVVKLKAINSGSLAKGTTFTIFPSGMENSPRSVKDGYTHFGTVLKSETHYINDIAIPVRDSEPQLASPSRNFSIYYNIEKDTFYLKDLGKGYGPFIKILHSTV
jgi:hypothetical protein